MQNKSKQLHFWPLCEDQKPHNSDDDIVAKHDFNIMDTTDPKGKSSSIVELKISFFACV